MVDQTITPVRQPLRRFPLTLRDELSAKLHKMMEAHFSKNRCVTYDFKFSTDA